MIYLFPFRFGNVSANAISIIMHLEVCINLATGFWTSRSVGCGESFLEKSWSICAISGNSSFKWYHFRFTSKIWYKYKKIVLKWKSIQFRKKTMHLEYGILWRCFAKFVTKIEECKCNVNMNEFDVKEKILYIIVLNADLYQKSL